MSSQWKSYVRQHEGFADRVVFDLGLAARAPIAGYSSLGILTLTLARPREDGLASSAELNEIAEIEEAISAQAEADNLAVLAGTSMTRGKRFMFFYARDGLALQNRVDAAMSNFPHHLYEFGTCDEPEWTTYSWYLFPSPENMQRVRNSDVLVSLKQAGDALIEMRAVQHWAYFPSVAAQAEFYLHVQSEGFSSIEAFESAQSAQPYGLSFSRVETLSAIDDVTAALSQAAARHGGEYDGWECEVVRE